MSVASQLYVLEPDAQAATAIAQARRRATTARRSGQANLIALLLPAALLAGAWGFQLMGGLIPCEMCHWQRWPHYGALVVAALAFAVKDRPRAPRQLLLLLAGLLIAASGAIAVAHAGVEYHWWNGFTACTANAPLAGATPAQRLAALMGQPVVRCDVPQWTFAGVSLAGFNALLSLGGAIAIFVLLLRRAR